MYINDLHLSVYSLQPLFLYCHFLLAPTPSLSLTSLPLSSDWVFCPAPVGILNQHHNSNPVALATECASSVFFAFLNFCPIGERQWCILYPALRPEWNGFQVWMITGLWPKQVVSIKLTFTLNNAGSSVVLLAPDAPRVAVTYLLYMEIIRGLFEGNLHNVFLLFLLPLFLLCIFVAIKYSPWAIL